MKSKDPVVQSKDLVVQSKDPVFFFFRHAPLFESDSCMHEADLSLPGVSGAVSPPHVSGAVRDLG